MDRDYESLSGMVVHQDHGGGGEFERAFDHLARIDRGVIDGAGLVRLVGDQVVTLVEEQNARKCSLLSKAMAARQ